MTVDVQAVFNALADPTRRRLFERLAASAPSTATELSREMPISRQAVAKHLTVLAEAGLVERSPAGREVRYAAIPQRLSGMMAWAEEVGTEWDGRLERLQRMVEEG